VFGNFETKRGRFSDLYPLCVDILIRNRVFYEISGENLTANAYLLEKYQIKKWRQMKIASYGSKNLKNIPFALTSGMLSI